jgi:hypothetical protein
MGRDADSTVRFTGTPSFEFSSGGKGRDTNLNEVASLITNQKETIDNHTTEYYQWKC